MAPEPRPAGTPGILVTTEEGSQADTAGTLVAELLFHGVQHLVAHESGTMSPGVQGPTRRQPGDEAPGASLAAEIRANATCIRLGLLLSFIAGEWAAVGEIDHHQG